MRFQPALCKWHANLSFFVLFFLFRIGMSWRAGLGITFLFLSRQHVHPFSYITNIIQIKDINIIMVGDVNKRMKRWTLSGSCYQETVHEMAESHNLFTGLLHNRTIIKHSFLLSFLYFLSLLSSPHTHNHFIHNCVCYWGLDYISSLSHCVFTRTDWRPIK